MNNLITITDTFKNILDIPDYYISKSSFKSDSFGIFDLYAHINDIKIFLTECNIGYNLMKSDIKINNSILISDGNITYRLYVIIDDFILLVINDIIKSLGGIIL